MAMKKSFISQVALLTCALFIISCGSKSGKGGNFPEDFNGYSTPDKVAFVMNTSNPDSVARFICDASLGKVKGVELNDLNGAVLYAYEHYRADSLDIFSAEFNNYSANLPLPDKMKIRVMAGLDDIEGLGFQLGLEYVSQIREKHMTADEVEQEIKALKAACSSNPDLYDRFLIGFKTVLEVDRGKDLPEDIYLKFHDYK